jgi:hypothetical protein
VFFNNKIETTMQTIDEQIEELYELAVNSQDNPFKRMDIGVVDETLGHLIFQQTNVDVTGYILTLDTFSIIHTLERHGNPIREARRGQLGIQKHHFLEILEVIQNPDLVRSDVKRNKTSLIFEKDKGDRYFVIKELREVKKSRKKNRLVLQSFYIKKQTL